MRGETALVPAVLYVDDDAANRLVFERTFSDGFRVCVASSGAEALAVLSRESVAVVMTDQRMPEMSGNELLTRVRDAYPDVVRMVVTAYSDLDPVLRAVNDGLVSRYVVKPWRPVEIDRILRWGVETFVAGRQRAASELELFEFERLATLGSIQAAVVHDLEGPLARLSARVARLQAAAATAPVLRTLVEHAQTDLPPADVRGLQNLVAELTEIASGGCVECDEVISLVDGVQRFLGSQRLGRNLLADPVPAVKFAVSVSRHAVLEAGGVLSLECPAALPAIGMGSAEITSVLISLISNAAKALGRSADTNREVSLTVYDGGSHLCFFLRDNGPGMTPEVLRQVGTPLFSTDEVGAGLGVSQARRIVEAAQGSLVIDSQEGVGTTVEIRIPRLVAERSPSGSKP